MDNRSVVHQFEGAVLIEVQDLGYAIVNVVFIASFAVYGVAEVGFGQAGDAGEEQGDSEQQSSDFFHDGILLHSCRLLFDFISIGNV